MRDREAIDSELRRLTAVRRSMREHGGEPSNRQLDELLDERLGHRPEAPETETVETGETGVVMRYRRRGVLRRFALLAVLPLSLLALMAVAAALVVMFAVHDRHPAAQAQPQPNPPSSEPQANPPPSKAPDPPLDIVERAFIDALKREGVPVPSHEYALTHGHAVCDFLAHQPNFAEAAGLVQRSSIWDADQSVEFTAGAIVSYCPHYETAGSDEVRQALQKALSDLQAIEGDLQGIHGDLQGIRDGLPAIPGQQ